MSLFIVTVCANGAKTVGYRAMSITAANKHEAIGAAIEVIEEQNKDFTISSPSAMEITPKMVAGAGIEVPGPRHLKLVEMLQEAILQLRYIDEKCSTGTTPAVIAKIENLLREELLEND